MKKSQNSSNAQIGSDHGRRDFLSLSLLAGSALLLSAESHGQTPLTKSDDLTIANAVGLADSLALYTNLLDDARRVVLQKDAQLIYVAKWEATSWLGQTTADARKLRALLAEGAALTDQQKGKLKSFLSDVDQGGDQISAGLIRMRQQPLEEIKNLDADFDKIRAELTAAGNALKKRNPGEAKEGIALAMSQLNKYAAAKYYVRDVPAGNAPASNQSQQQSQAGIEQRRPNEPKASPQSTLLQLLQTVLDLLNEAPSHSSDQNHATAYSTRVNYSSSSMVAPAQRSGITAVLRSKLNPSSYLQVAIGYAVTFPILMRVSDKNNRIKLLNDALRLIPPGLRNPLLAELASDLANVP